MSRTANLGSEEHYQGTAVNQGLHVHQQVSEIVVSVAEPHDRRIGDIPVVFVHQVFTCNGHDRSTKRVAHIRIVPEFLYLSLIHISEPTRLRRISYAVFCLKKK